MDWVVINSRAYDVIVVDVERNFNILYTNNTGRSFSKGAPLILDPLGTFYGHKVTFARKEGHEKEFDDLWDDLSRPRVVGMDDRIVYNQTVLQYKAYVSTGTQKLKRISRSGTVYWDAFQANFIPIEAQVTP